MAVGAGWALGEVRLREHRSGEAVSLFLDENAELTDIFPIILSFVQAHCASLKQARRCDEATRRYDMLLDVTFEGLAVHRDGVLIEVNEALARLYGYTREQMLGMRVADAVAPEVVDRVSKKVKDGFDGYYETVALRRDGSRVPLEARGRACIFDGKEARVASFRDLRDRKRAEAALEQARETAERASQLKTAFLGDISHEVRTPMTAILGLVDLVLESGLHSEQERLVVRIQNSARGLVDLLDQVLDVTRIEEGRASVTLAPFDLRAAISDSVASARRVRAGVQFRLHLDPGVQDVWLSDVSRVRQVLINLLDNAAKYTESGHVELRVTRWSDGLVFEVQDSGRGLSPDEVSSVFDRFVRGQREVVAVGTGAGLGLHITRQVVSLLGGELSVVSKESVGSTFCARLPMNPARAVAPKVPSPSAPVGAAFCDVLLAEDNEDLQLVIASLIRNMGHRVTVVGDGVAAIEACAGKDFDLVLMDVQMPLMDGLTAVRRLRGRHPAYAGFVVALTAHAMLEHKAICRDAGMDDYMCKPIDMRRLRSLLASRSFSNALK